MKRRRNLVVMWFSVMIMSLALSGPAWCGSAARALEEDFIRVSDSVSQWVVNISTKGTMEMQPGQGMQIPDPFGDEEGGKGWGFEFPSPGGRREFEGLGSGFIVSSDGYIVTNRHVIEDASEITVIFPNDDDPVEAKLIGADTKTDVAVIKVEVDRKLPVAPIGDSEQLKVGQWVLAAGNPYGLDHTITAGIVSAKGRIITGGREGQYDSYIQTDASINPGNSGGPLVDLDGRVVGINTAIFSETGGSVGIGFAIPINIARKVFEDLMKHGEVIRGWLGVSIQDITPELKRKFKLQTTNGALVSSVFDGEPAQKAGILRGDVIVEYDGKTISNTNDLSIQVAQTDVGDVADLKIIRNGKSMSFKVTIAKRPADENIAQGDFNGGALEQEAAFRGMTVQEITEEVKRKLKLKNDEGVLVSNVRRSSAAYNAGIQSGDVIVEMENKEITSLSDFNSVVKKTDDSDDIVVVVLRSGMTQYVVIEGKKK